jgi:uncharacterized membrane protein
MNAPDSSQLLSQSNASPAARNVAEIAKLEAAGERQLPLSARISLAITRTAGTFGFALVQATALMAWCAWNVVGPPELRYDPYPFGLLTMIVSMEGVVLAIFVLIAQNRMSAQSDQRDHLDLQVNLLAEQEMTMVLRMLSRISDHLGVRPDEREQNEARELMEATNVYELMEELRRKFR